MDPHAGVRRWTWLLVGIAACLARTTAADEAPRTFGTLEPGRSAVIDYSGEDPESERSLRREFEITPGVEAG